MDRAQQLKVFKSKLYIVLLCGLAFYLLYASRSVLGKLGIAVLCMVILDPLVKFFAKYMPKNNRFLAILATFLFLGLIVFLVLAQLIPILTQQFGIAISELNKAAAEATASGQTLSQALASNSPTSSVNALLPYIAKAVPDILSFLFDSFASLFSGLLAQLMVFGFVLFGLIEGPQLVRTIQSFVPKKNRAEVTWLGKTTYRSITSYITGNLFISLVAGATTFVYSLIIGLPYPMLMAVAVAICDLIPMFGAYLFGLVLGLFSWLFLGWDAAVISVIYVTLYQQFENQVLSPIVYNKANQLSPLTVLVVVSLGGAIGGLLGALIAIPIGTTIKLALDRYYLQKPPKGAQA